MNNILQYSAEVEIYLKAAERTIEVASCLENKCILRNPSSLPSGKAQLVITIDGITKIREVFLKDGITEDSTIVFLEFIDSSSANPWTERN